MPSTASTPSTAIVFHLRAVAAIPVGRRFVPPSTAVPIVIGEESWREDPRLAR